VVAAHKGSLVDNAARGQK